MLELTLLFLRKGDEILLAMKKRGFGEGRWNGVGGKLEPGETIQQALVREAKEEIGITPKQYEQVADISFDQFFKGEPAQMHVHVFTCTEWEGEPEETEEMRPKWYNTENLPFDSMWADDPYWVPLILEGKKIQAHFIMDESDTITEHTINEVEGFEGDNV